MVPFNLPFDGTVVTIDIDLTLTQQQARLSVVQSMYLDCKNATQPVTITVSGTTQEITLEAGWQGFFPLLVPSNAMKFKATSTSTAACAVIFLNVPVPASTWPTVASASGGTATITGPLAPVSAAGVDPVAVAQLGGGSAWTDHSVAVTVAATSSALFPAATAGVRSFVRVKAPETADLWINPKGGTAGISLVGCFKIPSGTLYENFPGESVYEAWTYYCATGGLVVFAQTQEGN